MMIPLQRIQKILASLVQPSPHLPPTYLYNEGWLLRLLLDWSQEQSSLPAPLAFAKGASWFSEASLPTPFAKQKGSSKNHPVEGRTKADGVIGHFQVGKTSKTGFCLLPDATQFVVLEAKVFSSLSPGVKHSASFDQAARNVACMAETLRLANITPTSLSSLAFVVLAPEGQIKKGLFVENEREAILGKVVKRVQAYQGEKDEWFETWFKPTLGKIELRTMSWEEGLALVKQHDPQTGKEFQEFYRLCLKFCN